MSSETTTPTDHHAEAERELYRAAGASIDSGEAAYHHARAQVHATLATSTPDHSACEEIADALRERLVELSQAVHAHMNDVARGHGRGATWERLRELVGR